MLALNFLSKLLIHSTAERYSANVALKHPWITRDFTAPIPLTSSEQMQITTCENIFKTCLKAVVFLASAVPATPLDESYISKLTHDDSVSTAPSSTFLSKQESNPFVNENHKAELAKWKFQRSKYSTNSNASEVFKSPPPTFKKADSFNRAGTDGRKYLFSNRMSPLDQFHKKN